MRKNNLSSLADVPRYLGGLSNLKKLSLSENPLSDHSNYRKFVIKALPYIDKLDNDDITHEERMKIENLSLEELISSSEINPSLNRLVSGGGGESPTKA